MTVKTVDFSVWPKGEPNTAYAQYFTGNSYLAPMEGGVNNVTFEPRCRNNWHIHHKDVQEGASNEWLEPVTDQIYNSL